MFTKTLLSFIAILLAGAVYFLGIIAMRLAISVGRYTFEVKHEGQLGIVRMDTATGRIDYIVAAMGPQDLACRVYVLTGAPTPNAKPLAP